MFKKYINNQSCFFFYNSSLNFYFGPLFFFLQKTLKLIFLDLKSAITRVFITALRYNYILRPNLLSCIAAGWLAPRTKDS
jgi:hypothetical protein